ncbi:hypothetical protein ANANG_G00198920, partial [Anguilla anguilla]
LTSSRAQPVEHPSSCVRYIYWVVIADVGQQYGVHPVQMSDQLPEAGLAIRAPVDQHVEPVDGEQGGVSTPPREDVAAGLRQLQKPPRGRGLQHVEGRRDLHGLGQVLREL